MRVVVFDGECGLCDAAVRAVIARDPEGRFRFASQQGEVGRRLLAEHGLAGEAARTLVLVEGGQAYVRSDAVLRIAGRLRGPARWLRWARLVPRPLRDALYDVVARHRRRLQRRATECRALDPPLLARFL